MMKWLVIKERESQQWVLVGPTKTYEEKVGRKVTYHYKSWVIPVPEHISPFVECHKIIQAKNREDAQCQILNLK